MRKSTSTSTSTCRSCTLTLAQTLTPNPHPHPTPHQVADLDLPQLHWDTSVLDMEEDRVIWVRESELGKDAPAAP